MKIQSIKHFRRSRGILELDLAVALAILALAILPVGYTFAREKRLLRAEYSRSVAVEIVDGEMEILAAGGWKNLADGVHPYAPPAHAVAALPPGRFQLTKTGNHLRLDWIPTKHTGTGAVTREVTVK